MKLKARKKLEKKEWKNKLEKKERKTTDRKIFSALGLKIQFGFQICSLAEWIYLSKETTLERADFTLQLLMFVTEEKERVMFIIFCLSIFCQLLSPGFWARIGWARPGHESSDQPA